MNRPDYPACAIKVDVVHPATANQIELSPFDRNRYSLTAEYGVQVPLEQIQYVLGR